MAFYLLSDDTDTDTSDLPWVNEFLELQGKEIEGFFYLVCSIKATKKGWILSTNDFNAWIWRKSKVGEVLQVSLTDSTQSEAYPQLVLAIKTRTKDKFVVGFMDDQSCHYQWHPESSSYSLHPQKNLPLDNPPQLTDEPAPNPVGKKERRG